MSEEEMELCEMEFDDEREPMQLDRSYPITRVSLPPCEAVEIPDASMVYVTNDGIGIGKLDIKQSVDGRGVIFKNTFPIEASSQMTFVGVGDRVIVRNRGCTRLHVAWDSAVQSGF